MVKHAHHSFDIDHPNTDSYKIMEAGKEHGLKPGHTSSIRRIEGGMLSYHADADINTNPFELGLDRLVNLESEINFIGKDALKK